jgi:TRAP-type mannitol/chloroaromatic compound transport system permease small subunit
MEAIHSFVENLGMMQLASVKFLVHQDSMPTALKIRNVLDTLLALIRLPFTVVLIFMMHPLIVSSHVQEEAAQSAPQAWHVFPIPHVSLKTMTCSEQ